MEDRLEYVTHFPLGLDILTPRPCLDHLRIFGIMLLLCIYKRIYC
jgi:hypothetical protein